MRLAARNEFEVQYRQEGFERIVQAPLLVAGPACHVERSLEIGRVARRPDYPCVGTFRTSIVLQREHQFTAPEIGFIDVRGSGKFLDQPVQRRQSGFKVAGHLLGMRQLIQDLIIVRRVRILVEHFLVLPHRMRIGSRPFLRVGTRGRIGVFHFQIAQTAQGLGTAILGRSLLQVGPIGLQGGVTIFGYAGIGRHRL